MAVYTAVFEVIPHLREAYCPRACRTPLLQENFFPRTCRAPFRMRGGYCGRACKRRGRRRDSVKVVPTLKMKTPEVLCTICQEEIELNAKCRKMPACKHIFHVECIDTWIAIRKHCPNCRSDITV